MPRTINRTRNGPIDKKQTSWWEGRSAENNNIIIDGETHAKINASTNVYECHGLIYPAIKSPETFHAVSVRPKTSASLPIVAN